ncbi:mitochondrial ribosome-associated GTPase 1 [Dorcoceras hygrometricum]|uniref:Mitochondrial ribosome-associated GTPase 1 n=1 Tax=Dorcoceras hygrometricum TaxID=472368 RepID=A0A2Z7AMW9_9LAMI|nr:mitochondrial ribosome-associated GTPase 1 [Dorcoceras hygrometricum]
MRIRPPELELVSAMRIDRSDLIGDRSYDEVTVMGMNRMFIRWTRARWVGPSPSSSLLKVDLDLITHNITLQTLTLRALVAAPLSSLKRPPPPPPHATRRRFTPRAAAASFAGNCSGQYFEENPSAPISSGLIVQADEGVSLPVVDLIDVIYRRLS